MNIETTRAGTEKARQKMTAFGERDPLTLKAREVAKRLTDPDERIILKQFLKTGDPSILNFIGSLEGSQELEDLKKLATGEVWKEETEILDVGKIAEQIQAAKLRKKIRGQVSGEYPVISPAARVDKGDLTGVYTQEQIEAARREVAKQPLKPSAWDKFKRAVGF